MHVSRGLLIPLSLLAIVLALPAGRADAKLPSYIITGGALGQHAMHFTLEDYASFQQRGVVEGADLAVEPAGIHYDIYGAAMIYRVAQGDIQPELRYYPDGHLLRDVTQEVWYRLVPERAAELDAIIVDALERSARGELERGVVAASLRLLFADSRLWLRPLADGVDDRGCPCDVPAERMEQWIMRDLVQTLDGSSLQTSPGASPELEILQSAAGEQGYDSYGWFGYYDPPSANATGRLWLDPAGQGFGPALRYFETTPGFDNAITEALRGDNPASTLRSANATAASSGTPFPWNTAIGGSVVLALAVAAGVALVRNRPGWLRRGR